MPYKHLPFAIKTLRENRGLTKSAVAEMAGISVAELHKIENGHWDMRLSILEPIARVLRTTPSKLLNCGPREYVRKKAKSRVSGE